MDFRKRDIPQARLLNEGEALETWQYGLMCLLTYLLCLLISFFNFINVWERSIGGRRMLKCTVR
jgi:hypothetical protein